MLSGTTEKYHLPGTHAPRDSQIITNWQPYGRSVEGPEVESLRAHHGAQPVGGLRHLIHLGRPPIAISPSPAVFSNESNSSSVISMASVIAAAEASITLRTSWCVF